MKTNTQPLTAAQVGAELEQAYASRLGWRINGGLFDHGRDLIGPKGQAVQVKSSMAGAVEFVRESIKRREFIPVVVGEPGEPFEMLLSLERYGAWCNPGLARAYPSFLVGMAKLRSQFRR